MAAKDPVEFRLYDTDLTTTLGILPAGSRSLYLQINEPGSGEVKIPLRSNAGGSVASAQFAQCRYRGGVRGGFFVENIGRDEANGGEREGQWMSLSGRGALALLEDAIVWDDGTTSTVREFSGTKAGALATLIDEAQARGALANLTYDFDAANDSDSNAWSDDEPVKFNVGMTLLDVVRAIAKTGIEFKMTPDSGSFILSAYRDGFGTDKSETVYMRVGVNCEEVATQEAGGEIRNALHIKYRDGYAFVKDDTSITARRRREGSVDASYAGNNDAALTFGQAELESKKDPKKQITLKVYDGAGPRAFVDYEIGDWVMVDKEGVEERYRVRGMHLSWDDGKFASVVVDLNSIILENEIRMAQDIEWLKDQWESARDANQLEVRFWASLLDATTCEPSNYSINDFAFMGNQLFVAGAFTKIGGVDAVNAAVLDMDTMAWSALGSGLAGSIYGGSAATCVLVSGTDVYFGGSFATAGGLTANGIAKWDSVGGSWSVMSVGFNRPVQDIVEFGGSIHITGWFDRTNGSGAANLLHIAKWTGAAWSQLGSGLNSYGECLLVDGATLYVGGQFTAAGGVSNTKAIASWNGTTFGAVGSGLYEGTLDSMVMFGTDLIVAGSLMRFSAGTTPDIVAKWDGSAWSFFTDTPFERGGALNPPEGYSLAATSTDLYVGGYFVKAGGNVDANNIARWNGSIWSALAEGLDGRCRVVQVQGQEVYAGGLYSTAGGKDAGCLAKYITTFEDLADHLENGLNDGTNFNMAAAIHNATAKTSMAGADEIGFWDSVSNALRKITWTNVLASIKTWADTIYLALTGQTANRAIVTDASGDVITSDKFVFKPADASIEIGLEPPTTGADTFSQTADSDVTGLPPGHQFVNYSDNAAYAGYETFIRGRGTHDAPAGVELDDIIGFIRGRTYDDTPDLVPTSVEIRFVADADHTSSETPTRIEFYTTPAGSTTRVKIATLTSDGKLNLESGGTYDIDGIPHTHDYVPDDGWIPVSQTWTAASSDDPVYQIYVSGNVTANADYKLGNKIAVTISGADRFGFIVKVGAYDSGNNRTPVDVYGGTDYDITGTMTSPRISKVKSPDGFPLSPAKWTVSLIDTTIRSQSSPVANTWYNLGSLSITIPIGVWDVNYQVAMGQDGVTARYCSTYGCLSTSSSSKSNAICEVYFYIGLDDIAVGQVSKNEQLSLTSKTTYYPITMSDVGSGSSLYAMNNRAKMVTTAVCAYL